MMIKHLVLAMVLLLLYAPTISAQSNIYSLQDVWQKVLENHPSMQAQKESLEAAKLRKNLVHQQKLPDIAVQSQHSIGSAQSIPGSFFPLPGLFNTNGNKSIQNDLSNTNLFSSALLQWNFFQFGLQRKRSELAEAAIQTGNALVKQEAFKLLSSATRLYFTALSNHAALKIANADYQRLSNLLDLLRSQAKAGLKPGADTLLLKSSLLQSESREHDHRSKLNSVLIQLAAMMNAQGKSVLVDTTVFYRFNQQFIGEKEALKSHPYLQVLQHNIQYETAAKEVIRKEKYPSFSLLAGAGWKGTGIQQTYGTYLAGVGLTWNFSSLYQNKTKQGIADRVIASALAEKDAASIQLQAQYAAAIASWQDQQQKLFSASASLQSAKQAYDLYTVRYSSGLISLIELLQLQKNLQEAEGNYVEAVSAYWNELLNQSEQSGDPQFILQAIKP